MNENKFKGEPDLMDWFIEKGFKIAINNINIDGNTCNWYAYKKSDITARKCECNGEDLTVVATPYSRLIGYRKYLTVDVEVHGEVDGIWFKLSAYSMTIQDLKEKIDSVEVSLIKAWNALSITSGLLHAIQP